MTTSTQSNEIFTQNFIDHFSNPRNIGEIENADGYAKIGDPKCGDFIKVWIKVENEIITDCKFKVFGCGGAIATTSVASVLAIGKRLKEAIKLTDNEVIQALGGIPENKAHCSLLGINGLRAAIADYLIKDNHKKYISRIEKYRQAGYDIPKHREKIVQFLNGVAKDAKILDIGTGKGHLALEIARQGWRCMSIDRTNEELYYARLNTLCFQLDEQIEFMQQDARKLEFPDNSFDVILCADMIHHVIQPDAVLSEMLRVCRAGGLIIISDINEKGQQALQAVLQKEGKEHLTIGWKMDKTKLWFEAKGYSVELADITCETVLKVII